MKAFWSTLAAALMVLFCVWVFGPFLKGKAPSLLSYSSLGWVRSGVGTNFGITTPRWHGWKGIRAALGTPFNHTKVWLDEGDILELDYDVQSAEGGLSISIYRTNLSTILQGALVEDHEFYHFRNGKHVGSRTYTARNRGWHEIDIDILWENSVAERSRSNPFSAFVPEYDLRFDVRWRLREDF